MPIKTNILESERREDAGRTLYPGCRLVGFFGYGVSLALFVVGSRGLGAARAGAYFSTAAFVGAVVAIPLLVAGALMAVGVWLHLTERHEHEHVHEATQHSHAYLHGEHHAHLRDVMPEGQHIHWHRHVPTRHKHPHYPDVHQWHEH